MKKSVLCCIVLLLASPVFATITKQQSAATWNQLSTTNCVVPFGVATGANNLIVVWTSWQSTSTFTALVGDSFPTQDTFVSAVGPTLQPAASTPTTAQIFYAKKIQGGNDTVTVTYSGTVSSASCVIVEYSGADLNYPLDSVSAGYSISSNSTNVLDSGTTVPANSNLLVFGAGTTDVNVTLTAGSNFTSIQNHSGSSGSSITEQNTNAITGNNTLQRAAAGLAGGGTSTGNWLMQMAVFRDASWTVGGGWTPVRPGQILDASQFPGSDVGAQLNAALAALPSSGGSVFVPATASPFSTTVNIAKPVHLTFGQGTFTYTGNGTALTCTNSPGVIIEGSGHDTPGTVGTEILVTSAAATVIGIKATNCDAITLRDFNLVGPSTATSSSISSITDTSGTATMVTASSLGVQVANQWVIITGTSMFNGTFQLSSFNNSTKTYMFSHAPEAMESSGTATLISPPSTGQKGIVISSTRSKTENVSVRSFEGDGFTIDGSTNANLYEVDHVHSAWNSGSGFVSLDCNGQVGTFLNDDAQTNRGDGFQIGNEGNTFIGTNTNSNASIETNSHGTGGIGYHFKTGNPCPVVPSVANNNTGSVFSDAPGSPESIGLEFESAATLNSLFVIGSGAPIKFESGANGNSITSQLPNVTDLGAGNRYQVTSAQLWNAFNTNVLQIGAGAGSGGIVRLFNDNNTLPGRTTVAALPSVVLNDIKLYTPNPSVDSTLLASPHSGITPLSASALGPAGCGPGDWRNCFLEH